MHLSVWELSALRSALVFLYFLYLVIQMHEVHKHWNPWKQCFVTNLLQSSQTYLWKSPEENSVWRYSIFHFLVNQGFNCGQIKKGNNTITNINKLFMRLKKLQLLYLSWVEIKKVKRTVLRRSFNTSLIFIGIWAQPGDIKPLHNGKTWEAHCICDGRSLLK